MVLTSHNSERTEYILTHLYAPLHLAASRMLLSTQEAEDVVMNVIYRVLHSQRQPVSIEHLKRRLFVSVRNEVINVLRFRQQHQRAVQEINYLRQPVACHPLRLTKINAELVNTLLAEIDKLSPQRRAVIRSYFFDRLTTPEIATMLGLSKQTVLNHKSHALRHLRNSALREIWDEIHECS